jgi:two-component system cell cycle sensor histidine kinase/response regulator CckA
VDLSRLVEEMLKLLKISISKHVVLKTDLPKDLPAVRGDAPQLRQVVMNLVINASEAIGDKDGVIRVTLSRTAPGQDLVSNGAANLREGDYLRLEVSDTGSGMEEETKARIFDPFFTTKFTGRGLGLAMVQSIVRDHGGAINVVSAPGQGTKFEIYLPCVRETAPSSRDAIARASGHEHRTLSGTVLVVEDEQVLRAAVCKMLRKKGLSVIEASDGTAALDLLRAHKDEIDLLLLDVTLPGTPSREVNEEARHLRPDLPVIVTSAKSEETAAASLARRVERFIRKPFTLDHLISLIRESLPS